VKLLDIAQVAQRAGVPASTLRYYEQQGLIASVGRRGLRRLFDARVLEQLAVIALGRWAGFSLQEIAKTFSPNGGIQIDRSRLTAKAEELDQVIDKLTAMRDGLRHAAACKARNHMECPRFRHLVKLAGAGRFGLVPEKPTRRPPTRPAKQ
jgi:MerR family redox-sensitive transcriptional activator SoxR